MSKKEIKERIKKIKILLKDYTELAPIIGIDEETQRRTVDMFLEDLHKELKALENEGY